MESHVIEWLNLLVRWFHFTTGVAWIGASFYFNWLENHLNRSGQREEIAGSLWAVHGGGFYYLEKYKVAPGKIPETLHWFKYEAYFTWVSGITLLTIIYYWNPQLYLVDSGKFPMSSAAAIALSLGFIAGGWFLYDALCRSPLGKDNRKIAAIGFGLVSILAYALDHFFSARAAYIHVGAVVGTCMVANVFFVIIPSQRALVAAGMAGKPPDGVLGKKALQRSLHNNYLTLPVLFIMISNHFPSTYAHRYSWLILLAVSLLSVGVRHWFNLKGRGQHNQWILPGAAIGMLGVAYLSGPFPHHFGGGTAAPAPEVPYSEIRTIINARCVSCHSAHPTDDIFLVAPAGVKFDTDAEVVKFAGRIEARAVNSTDMPFSNKTKMTSQERAKIKAWVRQGAKPF